MARNTGRGSRSATPGLGGGEDWRDGAVQRPLVVWVEPEGVAVYEGEKVAATRRYLLVPDEADALAGLLRAAASDVRGL